MTLQALGLGALVVFGAVILLDGRRVPLPQVVVTYLAERASEVLETEIELGEVALTAEGKGRLQLIARDVRLLGPDGTERAIVPMAEAELSLAALFPVFSAPRRLRLNGAELRITRRADGTLDLGSEVLSAFFRGTPPRTPPDVAQRIRTALARPALRTLETLRLDALSLTFADVRSGRTWRVPDAELDIARRGGAVTVTLAVETPGRAVLRAAFPDEGPLDLQLSALLDGVPAPDLAAQVPPLVWLAPIEAAVSGTLITSYGSDGALGRLDGTLGIGPGRLAPAGGAGVPFHRAQAYFTFRPEAGRIAFSEVSVEAPAGAFEAEGHAYLHGPPGALPTTLTAQIALREGRLDAVPDLPAPIVLTGGALDARVTLQPFEVEVGQMVLETPAGAPPATGTSPARLQPIAELPATPLRLVGRGRITGEADGLHAVLDVGVPEISPQRLLTFWPLSAAARTRDWLDRNILAGALIGTRAGLRLRPGARPDISLSFRFREAEVRAVRGLPPIRQGAGRAALGQDRFSLTVEAGEILPPAGGSVDVAGSVFTIPNTRARPGTAEVRWRSESSLAAALALLDEPPLRLLSRAGQRTDLGTGEAHLVGELRIPIKPGVQPGEIDYDFSAALRDVRSETLVAGRLLTAPELLVSADPSGLTIAGRGALDDVPLSARFFQEFGLERPPAEITGTVTLSQDAADAFGVALPPGTISGAGPGAVRLVFPAGDAPRLTLTSDLQGIGLRVPAIGWRKSAASTGRLDLFVALGQEGAPPRVERLSLSGGGLDATGRLTLAPGGGLDRLDLDRVRLGGWLDAPLTLRGGGAGAAPDVELRGGAVDLSRAPSGFERGGAAAVTSGGRISGRLDRLTLAENVALTGLRVDLQRSGGLSGTVSGRVNGQAAVEGTLSPGRDGRPAFRLSAADAGAVLAAAGAFEEARGGTLDLTLSPGAAGIWEGALSVDAIRVTAAPGIAALLNAISVVGLLDQLNGPGLAFSRIRAAFRLTPTGVELTSASAVGPSLGISAQGVYDTAAERIDLQGVLSPIYFVNSIGQIFTREGEGLFGMNYEVEGSVNAPEIRVNPLSILTPGAFRQIFRTAPPALPEQATE
ncbi:MAG: AsmA-like C-terminal region-containing protein [Pseudomonadota bacterium]